MPLKVTKPAKKNHGGRLTICQLEGPVLNSSIAKKKYKIKITFKVQVSKHTE